VNAAGSGYVRVDTVINSGELLDQLNGGPCRITCAVKVELPQNYTKKKTVDR
jgi:hypothetical protein